jgi:hypothetical protein
MRRFLLGDLFFHEFFTQSSTGNGDAITVSNNHGHRKEGTQGRGITSSFELFTKSLKIIRERLLRQKSPSFRGRALDLMYIKLSGIL